MSLLKALGLAGAVPEKTAAPGKTDNLASAADAWRAVHGEASGQISALKSSVKAHYAKAHPEIQQEIEKGLARLDDIMVNVDHRLAESLANASKAMDDGKRKAELNNAKQLLMGYASYVKSEPLIAHIDDNPFGVKTRLKALLSSGLADVINAIA